jgi:preprotein translocase subunit SecF
MSAFTRLLEGRTRIDFVGRRRTWYVVSAVLIGISLLALVILRLDLGLEFEGGVSVQAANPSGSDIGAIRDALGGIGQDGALIQLINGGEAVRVETAPLDQDDQGELRRVVAEVTGSAEDDLSVKAVEPRFGALIARQALIALGVFLAAVVAFISWRLEFKMAVTAIAALVHDLIITAGVYALTGFEVTSATVVALLTILGYSLYDTVVVFDRIAEEAEHPAKGETYDTLINRSMNHVLVRSLNTSLTSLIPVGSLLFVGSLILGAASLQDFALALFVGIATGTYSSVFVAGPLLAEWKHNEVIEAPTRQPKKQAQPYTPRLTSPGGRRPSGGGGTGRPPRPPRGRR